MMPTMDTTMIKLRQTENEDIVQEFCYDAAKELLSWRSSGWCLVDGLGWKYENGKLFREKKKTEEVK
jgi:hypothetical protein